jgi:hypothetical protein
MRIDMTGKPESEYPELRLPDWHVEEVGSRTYLVR